MSIHTPRGLYVLAYRKLEIDVKQRTLRPVPEITICKEFSIDGEKLSIQLELQNQLNEVKRQLDEMGNVSNDILISFFKRT